MYNYKGYALIAFNQSLNEALESYNMLADKQLQIISISFDVKYKMKAISVKFYKNCLNCIEN